MSLALDQIRVLHQITLNHIKRSRKGPFVYTLHCMGTSKSVEPFTDVSSSAQSSVVECRTA